MSRCGNTEEVVVTGSSDDHSVQPGQETGWPQTAAHAIRSARLQNARERSVEVSDAATLPAPFLSRERRASDEGALTSNPYASNVWLRLAFNRRKKDAARATLLALAGIGIAGCDIHSSYYRDNPYVERRTNMTPGAGDAVASNKILQMQDPWPAVSADRNLTQHGHTAAASIERYRTGKVIQPIGMGTSSTNYQSSQSSQGPASTLSAVPTTTTSAKP
jgi:hypothetical protein